jgi:hypothetical protein
MKISGVRNDEVRKKTAGKNSPSPLPPLSSARPERLTRMNRREKEERRRKIMTVTIYS